MLHRLTLPLGAIAALGAAACEPRELDLSPFTIDTRNADGSESGAVIAFEGDDGWRRAAQVTPGVFTFTPTGEAVTYARVCPALATEPRQGTQVLVAYTGLVEDRRVARPCLRSIRRPSPPAVAVGVTPADAYVSIANEMSYGWEGSVERHFPLVPGSYDLVAATDEHVLIRRGVALPGAPATTYDVEAEGARRVPVAVTLPDAFGDEEVGVGYGYNTAGGTSGFMPGPDARTVRVVPPELAIPGDEHSVSVWVQDAELDRSLWKRGTVEQVTTGLDRLPERRSGTASWNETLEVRWDGTVEAEFLTVGVDQYSGVNVHWSGWWDEAGRAAADPAGLWTPPDLSAVEGWSPSWNLDRVAIASTDWSVLVDGQLDDVTYSWDRLRGTFSPTGRNAASDQRALHPRIPAALATR